MALPRAEQDALHAALETSVNYRHGGFYRPYLLAWEQCQRHEANARYLTETLLAYCQGQTP